MLMSSLLRSRTDWTTSAGTPLYYRHDTSPPSASLREPVSTRRQYAAVSGNFPPPCARACVCALPTCCGLAHGRLQLCVLRVDVNLRDEEAVEALGHVHGDGHRGQGGARHCLAVTDPQRSSIHAPRTDIGLPPPSRNLKVRSHPRARRAAGRPSCVRCVWRRYLPAEAPAPLPFPCLHAD